MAERSFKLKLISAHGLNKLNCVGKMDVYAVAYISGGTVNQDQKQRTFVDRGGDSNPTWNCSMKFTIDEYAALKNRSTLVVKIIMEATLGDKTVGEVHVPIKELLEGYLPGDKPLRFVSYQVMKPSGRPNGELRFSYKFGASKLEKPVKADDAKHSKLHEPVTGYRSSSLYPPAYEVPVGAATESFQPPPAADAYYPPTGYTYQKQSGYGPPPPPSGYGEYPQQSGYGDHPPPSPVYYGYPPQQSGYGGYRSPSRGYDGYGRQPGDTMSILHKSKVTITHHHGDTPSILHKSKVTIIHHYGGTPSILNNSQVTVSIFQTLHTGTGQSNRKTN